MFGALASAVGGALGGPAGAAVGGAVGGLVDGGQSQQAAKAFESALSSFAMQIANDSMADFDEVMADTEEDA